MGLVCWQNAPLQEVGEDEWAAIQGESRSRLEPMARNGVVREIRGFRSSQP